MVSLAVVAALLGGCSESAPPPIPAPLSAPPSAPPTGPAAPYGFSPLTGEPATSAQNASRGAIAVAVLLKKGAPAPSGLDAADYVFEEVLGSGDHRLLAVYQSRDATKIGPVAGPGMVDLRLLPVLRPITANDGQPERFAKRLHANTSLVDRSYPVATAAYQKSGTWLYTSTAALYSHAPAGTTPPNIFVFVAPGLHMTSVVPRATATVSIALPGESAQVWTYDAAKGLFSRSSPAVSVANVIVLNVPYESVATSNKRGAPVVASADVVGTGNCVVASAGFSAPCTWSRTKAQLIPNIVDSSGYPIRLAPGPTWIVLAPTASKTTTE
ncbi:MAG TPA: DUF3048 C-terminal domain-containing protein [Micromonosporaceae bacterium]|nr:DUF3048 C-terminal domain-containing protein [Micromonosporaceae bacterium]